MPTRPVRTTIRATLLATAALGLAAAPARSQALEAGLDQIRHSIGAWDVVTEFLNDDGSVARSVPGQYVFEWVVPDRVARGRSDLPAMQVTSAILFYVNRRDSTIEMVSVGADGMLWVMKGPAGGEVRHTQEYRGRDGRTGQLRFTRYNVTPNRFESRMEYTDDGGATWKPGNHQVFVRRPAAATAADSEAEAGVRELREATRPYHDLSRAVAAGYQAEVRACIIHEHHGAMGYHHINRGFIERPLSPARPQFLLYERLADGTYRLNGAEFIIPYRLWPRDSVPPVFMGQRLKPEDTFQYWYLHVWAWNDNPDGMFADFHPGVRCAEGTIYRSNP